MPDAPTTPNPVTPNRFAVEPAPRHRPATPPPDTPAPPADAGWPRVRGYEILGVIGSGGMGVVYKARHRELNRVVALKTLRGAAAHDPDYRDRFRAEAEAVARLAHPNVIQIYEVGTLDAAAGGPPPGPFLALEFVDGGSLTRHTDAPQPPRFAAGVVEKLARAADAAHRVGVIHRDLKPANVLLTPAGEPKVADFGIAKQFGDGADDRGVTQDGVAVGTPEYMAPEQAAGRPATPAVDVYALGLILYELLTAVLPLRGRNAADTMHLIQVQEPVPPRRLSPSVPRDLETICLKCLAKTPARRYASAAALADDLGRWREGRTILARPVGPAERAGRWARRNPVVAGLWAALVLVGLVGLGGVVWKWRDAAHNAGVAEANAAAERWARYRSDMAAASAALRANNAPAARAALDDAPDRHRGWEYRHFRRQLDTASRVAPVFDGEVFYAEFAPAGGWGVVARTPFHHRLVDPRTGRVLADSPPARWQAGGWQSRMIGPDGRLVGWSGPDNTAALWDMVEGRERAAFRGHRGEVLTVAVAADGRRAVTGSADRTARSWDTATGRELAATAPHGSEVSTLRLSPDGARAVSAGRHDRAVRVWDTATGRELATLGGHDYAVLHADFSPRGDRIVTVEFFPGNTVRVWDATTYALIRTAPGHTNRVFTPAFRPDGAVFATPSMDDTTRLWETATGRLVAILEGHTGWVTGAAFSPDGGRLVTASRDQTVRVWEARPGAAPPEVTGYKRPPLAVLHGHAGAVLAAAYLPDGSGVASAGTDGTLRYWDARAAESGGALRGHTDFAYAAAFHPDGRRVASIGWDGTARVWDADAGEEIRHVATGGRCGSGVAVHPAGRLMATMARDESVKVWDLETGDLVRHWPAATRHWRDGRLAFSPGGLLAAACADRTARVWDPATGAEVAALAGHGSELRDVAFSPDGTRLATASEADDPVVRVWDTATWEQVRVLPGHRDGVYCLAYHPDSTLLASGSLDGTVRLWDTRTGAEAGVLPHGVKVYGAAFHPDGTRLATACEDRLIRLWDVATRQPVGELHGHEKYVHSVAFSPDGTRLVSASGDHTVRVWDTLPPAARRSDRDFAIPAR